jgi:hypothetical protein
VKDIAEALTGIDEQWMTQQYWQINQKTYPMPLNDDDLEYTLSWFENICGLYQRAAEGGMAVIFTADQ